MDPNHAVFTPTRIALAISGALSLGVPLSSLAAPFTVSATYSLGTFAGPPGANNAPQTPCGTTGSDALIFTGAGSNNIGIHTYGCGLDQFEFGSRSSGEGTYFVNGHVQYSALTDGNPFTYNVSPGHTGAWGNAFLPGEFQQASMQLTLTIGNTTYLDESFSVLVDANGVFSNHGGAAQRLSVSTNPGSFSYDWIIDSFTETLNLAAGLQVTYDIFTEASGNLLATSTCLAPVSSGGGEYTSPTALVGEGPSTYAVYCGAGAQTGDPIPGFPRALPEPAGNALVAIGALAMALNGLRRRKTRKYD